MNFTTIELLEVLEQRMPVYSFFTGFFPDGKVHPASKLQLDIKKGILKKENVPLRLSALLCRAGKC